MSWLKFGFALVEVLANLTEYFKKQEWYQQGVRDANAAANAEQLKRIEAANAARADHDAITDGVRDPDARPD